MIYVLTVVGTLVGTTGVFRLTYGPHWLRDCDDRGCDCPAARAVAGARRDVEQVG